MSDDQVFPVPGEWAQRAFVDNDRYLELYQRSIGDPDGFWREHGQRVDWIKPYTKVKNTNFEMGSVSIKWFEDGTLNAAANCIDRHLAKRGDQVAIIWEGDDPKDDKTITYRELHAEVCRLANGLKAVGVKKGDRVTIYLPMIPEAAYAMLACARIGAIHSVVFGGFSPDSLANRIHDCESNVIITADEGVRGGRAIPLKQNTDEALKTCPTIDKCIVVKRTGADVAMQDGRDLWYHELVGQQANDCPAEEMSAEDPLFILYTSGST
ncbi:MAG TPA: AMP-binding protein, partial [Alphaproteobacteria bacterium]|nr:AMP-binding protein [Alphaproteobacteria bacterium]